MPQALKLFLSLVRFTGVAAFALKIVAKIKAV